jgi:hypothetical protein
VAVACWGWRAKIGESWNDQRQGRMTLRMQKLTESVLTGVFCVTLLSPVLAETTDFSACASVMNPYEAAYTSNIRGIKMKGRRALQARDDGSFLLSHSAKTVGGRTNEQSLFNLTDKAMQVVQYDMVLSIIGIKREDHASFDWAGGVIKTWGRTERTLPLERPTFDGLSHQLALRCDIAQGKETVRYPVVKRGKVKDYVFRVAGEERLMTKLGELQTLVIERVRDSNKRSTRIWVAPELNHLVVRLEHQEGKGDVDFVLEVDSLSIK